MAASIDGRDLLEEDVRLVQQTVEFHRARVRVRKGEPQEEEIIFTTCPLGVKGDLTRSEIYEEQ